MTERPKPRKYQRRGVERIWEKFKGRGLLADEMGLGKTPQSLWGWQWYNDHPGPLVIVCPAYLKYNWEHEVRLYLNKRAVILDGETPPLYGPPRGQVYIINYDILSPKKRKKRRRPLDPKRTWVRVLKRLRPSCVVVDECFPGDTLVQTDRGPLSIKEIVENELPVKVYCFDTVHKRLDLKPVTRYFKNKRRTRLVQVRHSQGVLTCTENHKVWVERCGYVEASSLQSGDRLRVLRPESSGETTAAGAEAHQVLQPELLRQMAGQSTGGEEDLHRRMEGEDSGRADGGVPDGGGPSRTEAEVRTDAVGQPDDPSGRSQEDGADKNPQRNSTGLSCRTGRERVHVRSAENASGRSGSEVEGGSGNHHGTMPPLPPPLQGGHRTTAIQGGGGSGRTESPDTQGQSPGPEEGPSSDFARVDGVALYEHGNREEPGEGTEDHPFVYCLEVEDHHNFYADGILVSNCQYLKEVRSKRTRDVKKLQKGVPHFLALSGTGCIENCPAELWPVLNMINPKRFANFYPFGHRYCQPRKTPWGTTYKGATNTEELNRLLKKTCMVRRLAKDVLKELPKLESQIVTVGLSNRKEYDHAEQDLIKWLLKTNARKAKRAANAEKLVKWAYLRKCIADGKFEAVKEWVADFLATGKKLLLFGFHTEFLTKIHKAFKSSLLVTGKVPPKLRDQMFNRFNSDPAVNLLVGNIDAAGTGWSCRATGTVAFCELMWNPAKHRQAAKRVHGLNRGVKGEPARTVWLIAHNTIEEKMGAALQKKQGVQDQVLDGKKAGDDMDLRDLMEKQLMRKIRT